MTEEELTELEASLREREERLAARTEKQLRRLLRGALESAGAGHDAAGLLADRADVSALDWDDEGGITGAESLIPAMKRSWPGLFAAPPAELRPPVETGPAITLEALRGWKPEEINRRWSEVKGLLAGEAL